MRESIVYVTTADEYLVRIIKVHPIVKDRQYSYGGVKIEILRIEKTEEGEEYEFVAEVLLPVEVALMLGSVMQDTAMECVSEINNMLSIAGIISNAFDDDVEENKNSMYG